MSMKRHTQLTAAARASSSTSSPQSNLLKFDASTRNLVPQQHTEVQLPSITQSFSTLLSVLPPEIRYQIWQNLLANLAIDFVIVHNKLKLRDPLRSGNLLSILVACRQSYHEVHSLLFATTPIYLTHPSTLIHISNTFSQPTLDSIASVSLIWPLIGLPHLSYINLGSYQVHQNELDALKVWDVIVAMKGLKELKVELNVPALWRESWRGWEEVLLECLCEAGGLERKSETQLEEEEEREFALWVPWPKLGKELEGESSGGVVEKKGYAEKLGCKITWI